MRYRALTGTLTIILALSCTSIGQENKLPLPDLDPALATELRGWLDAHRQTPEEYILGKFTSADIVILGEQHRARQDPLLVQAMIPKLHAAGIYTLGTEHARRIDQPLIDSLLYAPEYDEALANEITLRDFVHWGYVEYVDIFRVAWELNKNLPAGARPFRILGLNNAPDWSHIKTQADRENPEVRKLVWHGETEADWAKPLLEQVISFNEKALVFCGIHHAFSEYLLPKVGPDGKLNGFVEDRLGRHVYNAIGKRVVTIFLHNFWVSIDGWEKPMTYPADGLIDALMATYDSTQWRVGFDTKGSPFGKLTGKTSLYSVGYDSFTVATYCDGWIFQMPFTRYEPITCIPGYYTEANIDYARRNAINPWFRDKGIKEFEEACEGDRNDNRRWWGRLH